MIVETAYPDVSGTGELAVWSLVGSASSRLGRGTRGSVALRSSSSGSVRDLWLPAMPAPSLALQVTLIPNATISKVMFHSSSV